MNKPQYLAELRRLLVFMTAADRERTVARCGELFDQAGPDGTDGLIAHIGSPTRVSIRLSRTYEPGRLDLSTLDLPAPAPAPEPEPDPAAKPAPAAPDMVEGLPDLDIPPMVMDDLSGFEMVPPEESGPEPEEASGEAPDESPPEGVPQAETSGEKSAPPQGPAGDGPRFVSMPLDHSEDPDGSIAEEPDVIIEHAVPLWVGVPLFIICLFVLALPIGFICLLLLPVLLLPGLALLLGTYLAAVGGLWCTSYIADALMLFGLAFLLLSLALVVLWCGLRLDVGIVSLFVRGCRTVSHLTLGKKVTRNA